MRTRRSESTAKVRLSMSQPRISSLRQDREPNSLPFAPIDGERIIGYRQALIPDRQPKSLAVIGSGAIGSELAFFYSTIGTEVTLIEYLSRIVPLEDDEVSAQLSRSFRKAGIKVAVSAQVKRVDSAPASCASLRSRRRRALKRWRRRRFLSAVGVVPNTECLGLEKLGVEMNRGR